MRIGVSFPTLELGADGAAIRDFVQTAEGLGYSHVRILDHVLGAEPPIPPGSAGLLLHARERHPRAIYTDVLFGGDHHHAGIGDGHCDFAATADGAGGEAGRGGGRAQRWAFAIGDWRGLESG